MAKWKGFKPYDELEKRKNINLVKKIVCWLLFS